MSSCLEDILRTILTSQDICKRYKNGPNELEVLISINFSIKKGEFVCIIGPNGSGKSTLLKIIAGISKPTSGRLKLDARISYLPQQPSLLPWRSTLQNLLLPDDLQKGSDKNTGLRAKKLMEEFDLAAFAGFYPHALSGGMQQKAALLRTVLQKPDLILLDEPFSALDAITRLELQKWLLNLWQKSRPGVICVTHDIREAIFLADTIYVLSERPGAVKKKVAVDLPRPRKRDHLLSKEAEKLEKQLNGLLAVQT